MENQQKSGGVQAVVNRFWHEGGLWQQIVPPMLLTVLTWFFYWPSLKYPFQFDDIANISKRFAIRFDNPFTRCWSNPRWFGDWLNTLNYRFGLFDPFYYRFFNVVIHLCAGLMVFWLVLELCKTLEKASFLHDNALSIAFATAVLFLLHPVQTQTVSYVIQARLEGLASLFVLTIIYTFVRAVGSQKAAYYGWGAACIILALISCGTKEIVIMTPFLLIIVDWFFLSRGTWELFKPRVLFHAVFSLIFLSIMIHYIGSHMVSDVVQLKVATGNNRGNILTPQTFDVILPFQFLISEFKVVVHYLTMFVWPFGISVEYDWIAATSFFQADVIFPFLLLLSIFTGMFFCFFDRAKHALVFGLLWFFITMAPRTTIIPSPELVCDYKTYLASVGIMFLLAIMFVYIVLQCAKIVEYKGLVQSLFMRPVQVMMLALLSLPLGYSAYSRNIVWQSCVGFWQDNVTKAPLKARAHNNLGVALCEAGKVDNAIKEYQTAIQLDGYYSDPLSNIAVAYSLKGDIDKAIDSLKSAIQICPNYPEAYNNMGSLLLQKKCYEDAERSLKFAIALRPYYGKAFYNLARLYEEKNDQQQSWACLKRATEGDLDIPEVFFKLGQMSLRVQKYKEAASAFEKIIEKGLTDQQVWFNLANAYFMDKDYDRAQGIYQRLTRDYPLDGRYAYNLGETYLIRNDHAHAFEMFRKVTQLPQPIPQAFLRVSNCLEKMNRIDDAKKYVESVLALNAPDDFKKALRAEMVHLNLQQKVNATNGSVSLGDLKKSMAMLHDTKGA